MKNRFCLLLIGLFLAGPSGSINAQAPRPAYLWQIGKPDDKIGEFAIVPGPDREFEKDGFFIIGKSHENKDWPFSHPGPESWSIEGATGWFFDKKQAFVGTMGDLGVHKADLLRWLLGEEIVEVASMVGHLYKPMGDVDDNAVCLLRTQSGAMGTLTASWTHNPGEDNATTLYGSKGILRLGSDPRFSVIVELASGERQFIEAGKMQSNEAGGQSDSGVIRAFVESIQTNTPPAISGEEGRRALAIILACLKSSETKQFAQVEL